MQLGPSSAAATDAAPVYAVANYSSHLLFLVIKVEIFASADSVIADVGMFAQRKSVLQHF